MLILLFLLINKSPFKEIIINFFGPIRKFLNRLSMASIESVNSVIVIK